ncbi:MAG: hypothetical protein ACOYNI_05345 [Acidimicrobiia bacterium]
MTVLNLAPQTPEVETQIAHDLVKKIAIIAPLALLAVGLWRGVDGALGVLFGLAVVAANFLVGAALLSWSARISPTAMAGAAMGGYIVRMFGIVVIALLVRNLFFVDFEVFVFTIAFTHIALLFWELRSVSLTMAHPGLKPRKEN